MPEEPFIVAFSSIEDYKAKTASILGYEPEITISAPDSIWASGLYISENFTSQNLLEWLKTALIENGFVDSSNAGNIFSNGDTEVIYEEENFSTNQAMIYINSLDYISINSINIYTDIHDLNSFDRKVEFCLPQTAMQKKGDEIRAYMDSLITGDISGEWTTNDNGEEIFTVSSKMMNGLQLQQFDSRIFPSDKTSVSVEGAEKTESPFVFAQYITENIDPENYVVNDFTFAPYNYYIRTDDSLRATMDGYEGIPADNDSKYISLSKGSCNGQTLFFPILIEKIYKVRSVNVESQKTPFGDNWKRTSTFTLEAVPEGEEQTVIRERLNTRLSEQQESEDSVDKISEKAVVTVEEKDSIFTVEIQQEGKEEDLSETSRQLFGDSGKVSYAGDGDFWRVKKSEVYEEIIRFGDLLRNVTTDFKLDYSLKIGSMKSMINCDTSMEYAQEENLQGGKLLLTTSGNSVNVLYTGTKTDLFAILFWVAIVTGTIMLVFSLYKARIFPSIGFAKVKTNTSESPVVKETSKVECLFCETCGAPREAGTKYCEKCGSKFKD